MKKITLKIDGMACSMCEAHVNEAIRNGLKVKKVNASAKKAEAVVIAEEAIPESEFKRVLDPTGYKLEGYSIEEAEEKKSLFSKLFSM